MIRIGMSQHEIIQRFHIVAPEHVHQLLSALIGAGIDQHEPAFGAFDENAVPLAHIQKENAQSALIIIRNHLYPKQPVKPGENNTCNDHDDQ